MPRPRLVARRVADLHRSVGIEVGRMRMDAGLTVAALARESGLDAGHVWRIEHGQVEASMASLVAIGDALGADLSIRLYPNTGPRIRDRHQAAIEAALLELAHSRWTSTQEVRVRRPVRGWIDIAFHDRTANLLVATEVESLLLRLEQLVRWHQEKVEALPSSDLWQFAGAEGTPSVTKLLVIRSTAANRDVARQFGSVLATTYPARTRDARAAIAGTIAWPGPAILWADVRGGRATILAGPPRGVDLGR